MITIFSKKISVVLIAEGNCKLKRLVSVVSTQLPPIASRVEFHKAKMLILQFHTSKMLHIQFHASNAFSKNLS